MPSPFARHSQSEPIALPFDLPHTIVVRKLTGGELEEAERAHLRGLVNGKSARGWAGQLARIWSGAEKVTPEAVSAILADPLSGFDRLAVVRGGLVSWSYDVPVTATDGYDPITDLDDEALEFIALEVMRRTKPALFKTAEQLGADRKNG